MNALTLAGQRSMVENLRAAMQARGRPVALFETHISWVLVGERHAYKFKKVVCFDFLDFSTLAARLHYCREELRLNRRLAPRLYEEVVPVAGTPACPALEGKGPAIDYAVRMRAFAQDALWSERIARGLLGADDIDRFAQVLARFHASAAPAPPASAWASPGTLHKVGAENIAQLASLASKGTAGIVAALRDWRAGQEQSLQAQFANRKAQGVVRECHGDLHCGNILTLDGDVTAFDCIEFDPSLRWIDVMHELAFPVMDLRQRRCDALAARLLSAYLERSGDYEGLEVFRYYHAESALVRAKVALLRARQLGRERAAPLEDEAGRLVAEAGRAAHPRIPALIIMHGFSGSGKSTVARRLVELFGAIQLRSDYERKRMHGIDPAAPAGAAIYTRAATEAVYERLRKLAASILGAGYPVLIDACNLRHEERHAFAALAIARSLPWLVVDVRASEDTMRGRIRRRPFAGADPSDADEAVLAMQLQWNQPLLEAELARTVTIDSEAPFDLAQVRAAVRPLWRDATA